MKYVDEFRDRDKATALLREIAALTDAIAPRRPLQIMEVCGGHTHAIFRYGIEGMLPEQLELVHGPGCPVCVLPMGRIDDCIAIADAPQVILTTFGDAMRVPGSRGSLLQAKADTKQAQINLDYTRVVAPFDGIVTARQVSVGELVGGSGTQVLATIVQLDPIYVNFTASERDVLRVRDMLYKRGQRAQDLLGTDIEVGLQTDPGYPHKGKLDYIAPTVNQSTGTLAARAELPNALRLMLPGFFVRVRVPLEEAGALLVPSVALGSDQAGRYVLVVNGENIVEQRKVETGPAVGEMTVIESGLKPDDRVVTAGLLRAVPGQKVDPQTQTAAK